MGQPQAAAEYIQATSRVGRRHPGLVVTLLNAARSRDRSHYEGFRGFHAALYRSVEATSVTPFSPRARDRGLHAVLVALARLTIPGLRENDDAAERARASRPSSDELRTRSLARVEPWSRTQLEGTAADLDAVIDRWVQLRQQNPTWSMSPGTGPSPPCYRGRHRKRSPTTRYLDDVVAARRRRGVQPLLREARR